MAVQNGVGAGPNASMAHGFENRVVKALAGVNQYLPAASSLVLNGKSMSQAEIVKELQSFLQLFTDLRDLRAKAQGQLKVVHTELIPGQAMLAALQRAMQASLGAGNPLLAQFGFPVGNRKPRSGATQVKAQAKAQLTRALRHTMGSRQRASLRSVAPSMVTIGPDGTVQVVAAPADVANTVPPGDPMGADSAQGAAK